MGKVDRTVRNGNERKKNVIDRAQETRLAALKFIEELNWETISLTRTWRTAHTSMQESRHEDSRTHSRSFVFFVSFLLTSNSLIIFSLLCFALLSQGKSFFQRTVFDVTFLLGKRWQQQNRCLFLLS